MFIKSKSRFKSSTVKFQRIKAYAVDDMIYTEFCLASGFCETITIEMICILIPVKIFIELALKDVSFT